MKKLITILSALTITSSILPLTVACKTTPVRKPSNSGSIPNNPNGLTAQQKADKAKNELSSLDITVSIGDDEKTKDQVNKHIKNAPKFKGIIDYYKATITQLAVKLSDDSDLEDSKITNDLVVKVSGKLTVETATADFELTKVTLRVITAAEAHKQEANEIATKLSSLNGIEIDFEDLGAKDKADTLNSQLFSNPKITDIVKIGEDNIELEDDKFTLKVGDADTNDTNLKADVTVSVSGYIIVKGQRSKNPFNFDIDVKPKPNPTTKTDKEKIKDAINTLSKFNNIKINKADVKKLKDQIKSQIKANFIPEDGVEIKGNIEVYKDNVKLENNDITIDEIKITVKGYFIAGIETEPFTLNTKVRLNFTKDLDINKITADMIINWKSEYIINSEDYPIKSEHIGSLPNEYIEPIIKKNLMQIMQHKLTGIDKTKLNDALFPFNDGNGKKYDIIVYCNFNELSDTEKSDLLISRSIVDHLIKFNIKSKNEENAKKFIANIEVAQWDQANKDNQLQKILDNFKNEWQQFLNLSEEEKKLFPIMLWMSLLNMNQKGIKQLTQQFLSFAEEQKEPFFSMSNINPVVIQRAVNNKFEESETILEINLDSIKSMYNLIKGTIATIEIDLTDKQ